MQACLNLHKAGEWLFEREREYLTKERERESTG